MRHLQVRALAVSGLIFAVCMLLAVAVYATISGSANLVSPSQNTIINGTVLVNTTWTGVANISISYNTSSSSWQLLNSSSSVEASYFYYWNTTLLQDGVYNLQVIVVNSTNASDSSTQTRLNLTIDNNVSTLENITAVDGVNRSGVFYIDESPIFMANITDVTRSISACMFSQNESSAYIFATLEGTSCVYNSGSFQTNNQVLNISFWINDSLGRSYNSTRMAFVVDLQEPDMIALIENGSTHNDNSTFVVTANVSDSGAGMLNGEICNISFNGPSGGSFFPNVTYSNATMQCNGTVHINESSGFIDGDYQMYIGTRDALDNEGFVVVSMMIDNTAPSIDYTYIPVRRLNGLSQRTNITINVSDSMNITSAYLMNGSTQYSVMSFLSGNSTNKVFMSSFNASAIGCADESLCNLSIVISDAVNNRTIALTGANQVYVDSLPPVMIANGSNVSLANFSQNISFFAKWEDVSLLDSDIGNVVLYANLSVYDYSSGNFTYYDQLFGAHFGVLYGNYTNLTYTVPGSLEGKNVVARISLQDAGGRVSYTDNISVEVLNYSPEMSIVFPANDTILNNNASIHFTVADYGIGVNLSSIILNLTGSQNLLLRYNASTFSCTKTYNSTNSYEITDCYVAYSWPLGDANITFSLSDNASNLGATMARYYVTNRTPDIVNFSIDGIIVANTTQDEIDVTISSNNQTLVFNWSVDSEFVLTETNISIYPSFGNPGHQQIASQTTVPANASYIFAPGLHYIFINAYFNQPVHDDLLLRLVVDVPFNASSMRTLYSSRGILNNWSIYINGSDETEVERSMNDTIDIIATGNASIDTPFSFILNYSGINGLDMNWNYSSSDFNITSGNATLYSELSSLVGADVVAVISFDAGSDVVQLAEYAALRYVELNLSDYNRSLYFKHGSATKLLSECNSTPSSAVAYGSECYIEVQNNTRVFLSNHNYTSDYFIFATDFITYSINVTAYPSSTIYQSIFPVRIDVISGFPNSSFCKYNISKYNNNISNNYTVFTVKTVQLSEFTLNGMTWQYAENITQIPDALYNYTVTCYDEYGLSNISKQWIRVNDTTAPSISGVNATLITKTSATIIGESNEPVNFTVWYSTNLSRVSYDLSKEQDDEYQTLASIKLIDLLEGETYYYSLRGCDAKAMCNITNGSFTTLYPSTSGSGGGGGGGGAMPNPDAPGAISGSDAKAWQSVAAGSVLEYIPSASANMSIHSISIKFVNSTSAVKLGVKQFRVKPANLPASPDTAYSYMSIDHSNVVGNTEKPFVEFDIPKAWLTAQRINTTSVFLYRYESDGWHKYPARVTEDLPYVYRFTAVVPGFSFFAVGGEPSAADASTAPATDAPAVEPMAGTGSEQTPIEQDSTIASDDNVPEQQTEIIVNSPKQKSFPWLMIIIVAAVFGVGAYAGLGMYKKRQVEEQKAAAVIEEQKREMEHRKEVAVDGAQIGLVLTKPIERKQEHDPMAQLHQYIMHMRALNHTEEEIRAKLLAVGWDEVVVDLELLRN